MVRNKGMALVVVTYIQYGLAHASSSDGLIFLDRPPFFPFSFAWSDRRGTAGFLDFRRTKSLLCMIGLGASSNTECLRPLAAKEGHRGMYPRGFRWRGGYAGIFLGVLRAFWYALERR